MVCGVSIKSTMDLILEKVPRRSRRTANVVEDDRVDDFGGLRD